MVVGVEIIPEAIEDAKLNSVLNGLTLLFQLEKKIFYKVKNKNLKL